MPNTKAGKDNDNTEAIMALSFAIINYTLRFMFGGTGLMSHHAIFYIYLQYAM